MAGFIAILLCTAGMVRASDLLVSTITTIAGPGVEGQLGDGGPATSAWLQKPNDVAVDAVGNVYVADYYNSLVRKITPAGVISTVAGNGTSDFNGDGIPATQVGVSVPGLDVDAAGNLYLADFAHNRVRKVSPAGIISTVAGDGGYGFSGDGGPATAAMLQGPCDVAVDAAGNVYILDLINQRIRKVTPGGTISTIAGNGEAGFSGDGGPATSARLGYPKSIALDAAGNLYIADTQNDRIRRVTRTGIISTVAGGGPFGSDPVATQVRLDDPTGVAVDRNGNLYISQTGHVVQMVSPGGIIYVVAGSPVGGSEIIGVPGSSGDGWESTRARLNTPAGLDVDSSGNVYIADSFNNRVRKLTPLPPTSMPAGLGAFKPYVAKSTPGWSRMVVSGDVTGDGRDDVVYSTTRGEAADPAHDYRVGILVQKTDGTLADPVYVAYPSPSNPETSRFEGGGLALGDFNQDGVKDIVVAHASGIHMVPGSRTLAFTGRSLSGAHTMPTDDLVVMDVNRDGKADVVASTVELAGSTGFQLEGLGIYLGNGAGGVLSRSYMYPGSSDDLGELRSGDVTGDGLSDLVIVLRGLPGHGGFRIFAHDGDKGLMEQNSLFTNAEYRGLSIADFNDDGRKDMAIIQDRGPLDQVLLVYGEDKTQVPINSLRGWRLYEKAVATAAGDVEGNGRDELVALHAGVNAVGFYQHTIDGLADEVKYFAPNDGVFGTPSVALGDVNHDGFQDAITIGQSQQLMVLHGTGQKAGTRVNGSQPRLPRQPGGAHPVAAASAADGGWWSNPRAGLVDALEAAWRPSRLLRQLGISLSHTIRTKAPQLGVWGILQELLGHNLSWKSQARAWFDEVRFAQRKPPGKAVARYAVATRPALSASSATPGAVAAHRRICQR